MTTQANKKQRTDTGASVTDDKTTPATAAATGVVAVDPQVAKALASSSTDLKRKKNAKTPAQLAEEEKYRLDASMKARMGDRAFYLVFDPRLTDLQLDKYNKSKGVLLDPVTKSIIAKSSVCMECCEFVVVASASRCSGASLARATSLRVVLLATRSCSRLVGVNSASHVLSRSPIVRQSA
jgi:hypothetical protein